VKDSRIMPDQDVIFPLKNSYNDFIEIIELLSDDQFVSPMHGWSPKGVACSGPKNLDSFLGFLRG